MKCVKSLFIAVFIIFSGCKADIDMSGLDKVEIKLNENNQYRLFVNGTEFYVKGAGSELGDLTALATAGGNCIRTWMDQEKRPSYQLVLDSAQANGLKVLMGLELGRERHGYDYNNEVWVKEQFDSIIAKVEKYKNHPALLAWVIGNEINLETSNLKVFDAVNDISKKIHDIDNNHLTTTTLAGIGKREVDYIKQHCTDIDFLSIQMYGDIVNLQNRIEDAGYEGPYMVTEWGATGHWEVARTDWDVAIEPTSKEKAESFIERYNIAIKSDPINCLGSFVFFWGQKQERTPTWYGMFLENGNRTETVDAMHFLWKGEMPENRCPTLNSILLNELTAYDNIKVQRNSKLHAVVDVFDHESDSLEFKWEILSESTDLKLGGDFETRPKTLVSLKDGASLELTAPEMPGAYRLFVYVTDTNHGSATANIPFLVE